MPLNVLLVEDNEALRELTRILLNRSKELTVVGEASDGLEAIEAAQKLRPDVILLDLVMPRMDGFEALPKLREAVPKAIIIAFTMLNAPATEERARSLGVHGFLDKGIEDDALVPSIMDILRTNERPAARP